MAEEEKTYTSAGLEPQLSHRLTNSWIKQNLPKGQIQAIQEIAAQVFGDSDVGNRWLRESNLATHNKPPISLLGSEDGFERVKTLLMRIEYGNLA